MNIAEKVVSACTAIPVAPNARLTCYKCISNCFAPSFEDARAFLARRRLFVITSTGRTGTAWLAALLNRIEDCTVVHEPLPIEQCAHVDALQDLSAARNYIADFRIREMAWRSHNYKCATYGEVNGALRRHIAPLREFLPHLRVIHLVRNPRDVLISMLNRAALSDSDRVYSTLMCPTDIERDKWESMGQFAKLCWLWSADNAYLRKHSDGRAIFEDITGNFGYLDEQVLKPIGLTCDEAIWNEQKQLRRNATNKRKALHGTWTRQQERTFEQLVLPELEHYPSYSLGGL